MVKNPKMYNLKELLIMLKLFKLLSALMLVCSISKVYADGHKAEKGPELEYFGTLSYADITRMNGYKEILLQIYPLES